MSRPATLTAAAAAAVVTLDTLTAAATDPATRTITGRIAPYGIAGRTSQGLLSIRAGALTWDTDLRRIKLTNGHDRDAPLGYCTALDARPDGLWATFRVAATPAGDAALLEAVEGVRDGLSVDLVDVAIDGDAVTAGQIAAVGLCTVPAYGDARVMQIAATADTGAGAGHRPAAPPAPGRAYAPPAATPPARTAPVAGTALTAVADAIARTARGDMAPAQLAAVLSDFTTNPASGGAALPPQWVGDLWTEADVPRPHVDAITGPRPLTSLKVQGFKWNTGLQVGPYTGEKSQIPTNAPTLTPVEEPAERWAGGVDVDRAFLDLGSGDVIRDLLVQATNDYKAKTDLACLSDLLAVSIAGAATTIQGALAVVWAQLHTVRVRPTYIGVATNLFATLGETTGALMFGSASISADGGDINGVTFTADPDLPDNAVLGLNRAAATFYEKGPIQVDAVDIAKGGVDEAVFGYSATLVNRVAAISHVTVTLAGARTAPASK